MDDELKNRLVGYLDTLEKGVTQGGEFIAEQAPEVVQQYLAWMMVESIAIAAIGLIALMASAVCMTLYLSRFKQVEESNPAIVSALIVSGFFGAFAFAHYSHKAAKVCVAPKVVIVEKLAELAK